MQKDSYNREDLLECARGDLFGPGNAQLPMPPMLMFDRITLINSTGGSYANGVIKAELDINPNLWFFDCHFLGDPVMPGCLGLDALWQLLGFYLGWKGLLGHGRALGVGEVKFSNQVQPKNRLVSYQVDIRRVIERKISIGIGNGQMYVDNELAYEAKSLRVTLIPEEAKNQ